MGALGLDEMVEPAALSFEGRIRCDLDVGANVLWILRREEEDAGWVHHESGLQHETGESLGLAEVGVG